MKNRPPAYPTHKLKAGEGFKPAPFSHKSIVMVVPKITITVPFVNGKCAYLEIPANYSNTDLKIIIEHLAAFSRSLKIIEEEKKSEISFIKRFDRKQIAYPLINKTTP